MMFFKVIIPNKYEKFFFLTYELIRAEFFIYKL